MTDIHPTRTQLAVAAAVIGTLALPLVAKDYYLWFATSALIAILYGSAYNLLYGYTGALSFGHAVFFGLGGYATVFFLSETSLSLLPVIVLMVLTVAIVSFVVSIVAFEVDSHEFVIVTIIIVVLANLLSTTFTDITGGSNGLSAPPTHLSIPLVGELSLFNPIISYVFVAVVTLAAVGGIYVLTNSSIGLVFMMIRENEARAASLGHNVTLYKRIAFVLSGCLTGLAGAMSVLVSGHISPQVFSIPVTTDPVLYTLIGGRGTILGPIVGAVIVETMSHFLEDVTHVTEMVIGLLLILVVVLEKEGLMGLLNTMKTSRIGSTGHAESTTSEVNQDDD